MCLLCVEIGCDEMVIELLRLGLDLQVGTSYKIKIDNLWFDAFPSKTLVLVNIIRTFRGVVTCSASGWKTMMLYYTIYWAY